MRKIFRDILFSLFWMLMLIFAALWDGKLSRVEIIWIVCCLILAIGDIFQKEEKEEEYPGFPETEKEKKI